MPSSLTVGDLITAFNKGSQQPNPATAAAGTSHQKIGFTQGVVGPGPLFPHDERPNCRCAEGAGSSQRLRIEFAWNNPLK